MDRTMSQDFLQIRTKGFTIFYYVAEKKFAIGDDRPLGKGCFRQDVTCSRVTGC
jgi:hypothetical protein